MDFTSFIGMLATITATGAQLVGIKICFQIVKKGSTGNISPAPFFAFLVNSCIWLKYGILTKILSLIVTNGCGTVLQFLYISIYYFYSNRKTFLCRIFLISCILLVVPLVYADYYESDPTKVTTNLGMYGCVLSVMCYASPLATVSQVLRYKSTDSMSFPLVVINFMAAIEWSMYGIALDNRFVTFPSVLGSICALSQLSLFIAFGRKGRHRVISGTHKVIDA